MARRYGLAHEVRTVGARDFREALPTILEDMDQPSIDGVNSWFVCRAAADAGFKVALSGLGGDELFGGYPSFRGIPRLMGLTRRARFASATAGALRATGREFRRVAGPVLRRLTSPKWAGLLEYSASWEEAYLLRRGLYMPWELPRVLDPDLAREGWERLRPLLALREAHGPLSDPHLKVAALEMTAYMRGQLLRKADWAGMAHSVEVRVPLVDPVLLERVAPLLVGKPRPGKADMAAAPATPLPDAVLDRDKTGFSIPVDRWIADLVEEEASATANGAGADRGLRPWARFVFRHQADVEPVCPPSQSARPAGQIA